MGSPAQRGCNNKMTGYYSIEFVYMHELHNKNALNQKSRVERKERKLNSGKREMFTNTYPTDTPGYTHTVHCSLYMYMGNMKYCIFCIICGRGRNVFCWPPFTYSFCSLMGCGYSLIKCAYFMQQKRPESWP